MAAGKTIDERAKRRAMAVRIALAIGDGRFLAEVHDYRIGPTAQRTPVEAEEAPAIDSTKFGDLDASLSIERAFQSLTDEIAELYVERGFAERSSRMDLAERQAFRAFNLANRDKVVEVALEIAKHWGEQGGVNGAYLDRLAELAGYPTRGYRKGT